MANISITLMSPAYQGQEVTFRSPADCSKVTGLKINYPDGDSHASQTFQFADAHGNNVGSIDLFAADALVKVILDTELERAYVQNADTNAYLEGKFNKIETDVIPIKRGGTGASTAQNALANLGAMSNTLVNEEFTIKLSEGPTLDETLKTIFANMPNGTNKIVRARRTSDFPTPIDTTRFSLGGGTDWMVLITRSSSGYGALMAWQHQEKIILIRTRAVFKSTWHDWIGNDPKVLWQNPKWGSADVGSLTPQTLNLDPWAERYNCLMIVCRHKNNSTNMASCLIMDTYMSDTLYGCCQFPAHNAQVFGGTSEMSTWRFFRWEKADKTKLLVTTGMYQYNKTSYSQATNSNGACVPVRVYGLNV